MADPVCPVNYDCEFTPMPPDHVYDPWWTGGPWAIGAGILAVIAITALIAWLIYMIAEVRANRSDNKLEAAKLQAQMQEAREKRAHELAVEEQRTLQLDAAQGNPEVLKLVQRMRS